MVRVTNNTSNDDWAVWDDTTRRATFTGYAAKKRAHEYAFWLKNG
jgi:hypothetical protein